MTLTVGALFAGYGGLEMGVQSVLGGELAWYAEWEKAPAAVMAHHHPGVPNLGDVTKVDWHAVPPVDVITGGYPCQPFSHAGGRMGTDDPRHLWPYVAEAVGIMRPALCVFENVRGHLSLGFDEVLRDLHLLGYSVRWYMLRAADIGAAHGRARIFIYAEDTHSERLFSRPDRRGRLYRNSGVRRLIPSAPESVYDRQGSVRTPHDAQAPWGEVGELHAASGCTVSGHLHLADDRSTCLCGDRTTETVVTGQGTSCGCGLGVSGDGGCIAPTSEWSSNVDGRDAFSRRDVQESDPGSEPKGTGPRSATTTRRKETCCCLSKRLVVGAGGRPVRPGGVPGKSADVRADGGRSCVCGTDAELADVFLYATPADANDQGREECGVVGGFCAQVEGPRATVAGSDIARPLTLFPTPAVNDMGAGKSVEVWDAWTDRMQAAHGNGNGHDKSLEIEALRLLPTPTVSDANGAGAHGDGGADLRTSVSLLPTPRATGGTKGGPNQRGSSGDLMLPSAVHALLPTPRATRGGSATKTVSLLPTPTATPYGSNQSASVGAAVRPSLDSLARQDWDRDDVLLPTPTAQAAKHAHDDSGIGTLNDHNLWSVATRQDWGRYEAAIRRQEAAFGHPAPSPTEPGAKGQPRLSPKFVEWLMALPPGWVTHVPGVSRNDQLKALGNGVSPPQCAAATRAFLHDTTRQEATA